MRGLRLLVIGACSYLAAQQPEDSAMGIVHEWRNSASSSSIGPPISYSNDGPNEPGVFVGGNGVTSPLFCSGDSAELPLEAAIAGLNARVFVLVAVKADGSVHPIKMVSQVGFGFEEKALLAVKSYRFVPGDYRGKPVAVAAAVGVTIRNSKSKNSPRIRHLRFNVAEGGTTPMLREGDSIPIIQDKSVRDVALKLHISEMGRVTSVSVSMLKEHKGVANALGNDSADVALFQRLRTWRFQPATLNGAPIGVDAYLDLFYPSEGSEDLPGPPEPEARCASPDR